MSDRKFPIVEIFGPVYQGEGKLIGQKTHFIRFGGCDSRCNWCDTLYAVIPEEVKKNSTQMATAEILEALDKLGRAPWITLSGGNPAIHDLTPLVRRLSEGGYGNIALETQATKYQSWIRWVDLLIASPKPPSSGMMQPDKVYDDFFSKVSLDYVRTILKIVVFNEADYAFARHLSMRYSGLPVYLQPGTYQGVDTAQQRLLILEKLQWLWELTAVDPRMSHAVILPQLHTLVYGNRRGV